MCDLYLSDELERNESGHFTTFYRLHARNSHSSEMEYAYDIKCPKCTDKLKLVGRRINNTMLGLYTCPCCNLEKTRRA